MVPNRAKIPFFKNSDRVQVASSIASRSMIICIVLYINYRLLMYTAVHCCAWTCIVVYCCLWLSVVYCCVLKSVVYCCVLKSVVYCCVLKTSGRSLSNLFTTKPQEGGSEYLWITLRASIYNAAYVLDAMFQIHYLKIRYGKM